MGGSTPPKTAIPPRTVSAAKLISSRQSYIPLMTYVVHTSKTATVHSETSRMQTVHTYAMIYPRSSLAGPTHSPCHDVPPFFPSRWPNAFTVSITQ